MKENLRKLLKDIFLSSLASLTVSSSYSAEQMSEVANLGVDENEEPNKFTAHSNFLMDKPKLTKPFILKRFDEFHAVNLSHRSHRSHSSHRSHYSGSSGSSYGSSSGSTYRSSSSGSSGSSNTAPSGLYQSTPSQTKQPELILGDPKVFKLGDRTIRLGMKGMDVTEVVNILLRKKYLQAVDESKVYTIEMEYMDVIQAAIKRFQSDSGIDANGIVNTQTVYLLKQNN